MQTITLSWCPKCDRATDNWRACPHCGQAAVKTTFALWPLETHSWPGPPPFRPIIEGKGTAHA